MRYYLIVFLLLLIPIILVAQGNTLPDKDIIILKNKPKLEGEILEVSKRYVRVKVRDKVFVIEKNDIIRLYPRGQEITFLPTDIKRADFEYPDSLFKQKRKKKYIKKEYLKKGFYNISYLNVLISAGAGGGIGVKNITGYQFNKYLGLGLGVGFFEYNTISWLRTRVIPITSEIRGYLSEEKIGVYYNLAIGLGAALKLDDNYGLRDSINYYYDQIRWTPDDVQIKGGLFLHPAIGYKFGSDKIAFMLDLGIQVVNVKVVRESDFFGRSEEKRKFQNVVLRLGIML